MPKVLPALYFITYAYMDLEGPKVWQEGFAVSEETGAAWMARKFDELDCERAQIQILSCHLAKGSDGANAAQLVEWLENRKRL